MSNIIALEGAPSKGKSTTIGMLYEKMKTNDYSIIQDKKRRGSKDFFVIVEKNRKKIGVTTYGDNPNIIKQKLDFFISKDCTVIVTACRPSSQGDGTKAMVESYTAYTRQYLPKTVETNASRQTVVNLSDAETLLAMVESVF
jgi:hypothetical protein